MLITGRWGAFSYELNLALKSQLCLKFWCERQHSTDQELESMYGTVFFFRLRDRNSKSQNNIFLQLWDGNSTHKTRFFASVSGTGTLSTKQYFLTSLEPGP